jgi:hypothetical protein
MQEPPTQQSKTASERETVFLATLQQCKHSSDD